MGFVVGGRVPSHTLNTIPIFGHKKHKKRDFAGDVATDTRVQTPSLCTKSQVFPICQNSKHRFSSKRIGTVTKGDHNMCVAFYCCEQNLCARRNRK